MFKVMERDKGDGRPSVIDGKLAKVTKKVTCMMVGLMGVKEIAEHLEMLKRDGKVMEGGTKSDDTPHDELLIE